MLLFKSAKSSNLKFSAVELGRSILLNTWKTTVLYSLQDCPMLATTAGKCMHVEQE